MCLGIYHHIIVKCGQTLIYTLYEMIHLHFGYGITDRMGKVVRIEND